MKSRPIMFSTPMIQALPYKSQTRRTRGLEIVNKHPDMWNYLGGKQGIHIFEHKDIEDYRLEIKCPYGVKGDQLWCKETYGWVEHGEESDLIYKADGHFANEQNISKEDRFKWKSAMFMFRWMSRHLLELVEEPIPQRLWDITEADAKAEGAPAGYIEASPTIFDKGKSNYKETLKDYRAGFARLWDSINRKKYPWSGNYWDWKLVFREIKQ